MTKVKKILVLVLATIFALALCIPNENSSMKGKVIIPDIFKLSRNEKESDIPLNRKDRRRVRYN